jgi:hypothetical protein
VVAFWRLVSSGAPRRRSRFVRSWTGQGVVPANVPARLGTCAVPLAAPDGQKRRGTVRERDHRHVRRLPLAPSAPAQSTVPQRWVRGAQGCPTAGRNQKEPPSNRWRTTTARAPPRERGCAAGAAELHGWDLAGCELPSNALLVNAEAQSYLLDGEPPGPLQNRASHRINSTIRNNTRAHWTDCSVNRRAHADVRVRVVSEPPRQRSRCCSFRESPERPLVGRSAYRDRYVREQVHDLEVE